MTISAQTPRSGPYSGDGATVAFAYTFLVDDEDELVVVLASSALAYVAGMSVTYAAAGVAAAYSGSLLASALQNPWVLSAFALVFVWLALSMYGFHDIQLPVHHRLSAAHNRLEGGQLVSVALMGVLSAVIVSPCGMSGARTTTASPTRTPVSSTMW